MSVVVSAVAPGFDVDLYEAVTSKVMPDGQLADGCELHIAGPVEDGVEGDLRVAIARGF